MWLQSSSAELGLARRFLTVNQILLFPVYALIVLSLYGTFLYAPTEKVMGEVQRIFYFHVGSAFGSFAAFFVVFLCGIAYLKTKSPKWDAVGAAAAEVGTCFTVIVLITGPIWAKPVWNTWFPWGDPRVMTELVLLLIFIAYFILRGALPEGEKKYKFAAVFGIIGALDVPIVHMSIRWWRTIHPQVITATEIRLEPAMRQVFWFSVFSLLLLTAVLILLRSSMRLHHHTTQQIQQSLRERRTQVG